MSELWAIIQAHLDEYGVREAAFARRMGTKPQTLSSWKHRGLKELPARWLLEAVAREARQPYETVLRAVLADIGYGVERHDAPPMNVEVTDAEFPDDEGTGPGASPEPGPDVPR